MTPSNAAGAGMFIATPPATAVRGKTTEVLPFTKIAKIITINIIDLT